MKQIIVLLASLLLISTPLAGCLDDVEELIDDIVGCMDAEAKNYDENATTELVGNCIYAASMNVFMDAMDEEMDLQSMLNKNTTAGYSMSTTMPMEDNGMVDTGGVMMLIEETVMVNMSANAAHVSMSMSMPMMLTQATTMTQVGEIVNVHHKLDGMMVTQMGGETIDVKYQTRDMSPNVMEWVLPMLADSMVSDMTDDSEDDDDDDDDDGLEDDFDIENATISVSFDSATNTQTMDMSTTNETGAIMNLSIKIDEASELMSYSMEMTNETGSTIHMSYAIMWGDAVVITVDQTLPKTAIPVYWDGLLDFGNHDQDDDDDDDDDGHNDVGEMMDVMDQNDDSLVSWDEFEDFIINYDGGFEDDQDRLETQAHFDSGDANEDGYLDYDEFSDWMDSMDHGDSEMFICDNGEEIPEDYVNDGYADCDDGSDEFDDGNEEEMFLCESGEEIPSDMVNDGYDDCYDGSDEFDDGNEEEMWMCDNGEEIPLDYVNDGVVDCSDGSDEDDSEMWMCDNGEEIPLDYVNDGVVDCSDGSDEDDSDDNEPEMWMCDNGEEIPLDYVDDGEVDCSDGSDEDDSDDNEPEMWMCDNGEEIPLDYVDDGEVDCSDGSDEDDSDDDEPRDLSLTVANNQTFEALLSDFSIQFLSCNSDIRSECNVEESASLTNLTGQMGDSSYVYADVDADGMISAGDTLVITSMNSDYEFDLYDSWSDSYVSDSGVNGPNMPGFGGLIATISMLGAAFLLPRRDED